MKTKKEFRVQAFKAFPGSTLGDREDRELFVELMKKQPLLSIKKLRKKIIDFRIADALNAHG